MCPLPYNEHTLHFSYLADLHATPRRAQLVFFTWNPFIQAVFYQSSSGKDVAQGYSGSTSPRNGLQLKVAF
uniref:Uncharacterized protein n=1 Tax=Anguilla anguilla TaxID=7936 RepID=A0A0E9PV60_ANGAN